MKKGKLQRNSNVAGMRRVSYDDYLEFLKNNRAVEIEGNRISLEPIRVKRLYPLPQELTDISTTVWSFPKRGSWATHRGDYRGNWPPQMARALILAYTMPGETVLDPMIGSGTTCIEAKLLGRNCIGVDINYNAVILTLHRLYWLEKYLEKQASTQEIFGGEYSPVSIEDILKARVEIYHGDARNLDKISSNSIDLVATHPPYYNIIRYSRTKKIPGDLSGARRLEEYLAMIQQVGKEAFRVLKPGRILGILIGDTRIHKHYVPITHHVLETLLKTGFILKEEVVKIQHKMKTTREIWSKLKNKDFLLIYHEKLFILRKPIDKKEYRKYKYSTYMKLNV
ncbi:TRM11 family SAM-dependent methyltransferase [Staphylothermus hellenicus]|uniref:Type II methyltransferase n=1 Tax=Staphylothermus hellenicus (strain DSM 12710 / JCM 10830 / BK20S6-10-b1 / P8) TaxID=591019 RepID=D7DB04_STAHD|nr:DNA methyltransferase [Staphylothermus hellenicus]ADI31351.1 putative RNA methylase [Staphylothermus hellenicus DSM 12710]